MEAGKEFLTFKELMGTEMVDLYVGPSKEHFRVHKTLLCAKIPYFYKMFKGKFTEASTNRAEFPEDSPESFDLLLGWVYQNTQRPLRFIEDIENNGMTKLSWDACDFYNLVEKICLRPLQDRIMDIVRNFDNSTGALPAEGAIRKAYSKDYAPSPFRKYMSHWFAYILTKDKEGPWDIESYTQLITTNIDLARDVLRVLRQRSGMIEDPCGLPNCYFHSHDRGEPCYHGKIIKDKTSGKRTFNVFSS